MQYVYHEPAEYTFENVNGHSGKVLSTSRPTTEHLIITCDKELTVSLIQHESEFNYYILEGTGFFAFDDAKQDVQAGDLVVIPPNTKYTFAGKLKMLLINTPHWSKEQEEIIAK